MANFLLAWWNAEVHGGFDLTDLANVDRDVADDMATIFTWLAREDDLAYPTDYRREVEQIIAHWRPKTGTA
ncbi:DUF7673 family protein [Rhizobium sp. PP-CC-3G-465]|uniref:DUF7673 family protein n=1 Tax=Rhizobium sp. PP-CC-3G-465 TaxID=2135648 RepID=UPI0010ED8B70|nr:hypothetical protein C8J31_12735 [Rhizobium sp. PP-CC-2G-626]TCQ16919.1 hypothetical protein C8J33_11435 [Rhizobium sp. PP-CC-3G-465]